MENEIARDVVDAALTVHKTLGPGLLESAYEVCLAHELRLRDHDVRVQEALPLTYKGVRVEQGYRLDMLVDGKVVIELKAVDKITDIHRAQILSYLRLGDFKLGFLINFNVTRLKDGIQRFANGMPDA